MRFFEAAADWADRKAVDLKFCRDEYDGWFAIIGFQDSRGPFSAMVNMVGPNPRETNTDYADRVSKMMDKACVTARANRIRVVTGSSRRVAA
jgi:hypothetical protein